LKKINSDLKLKTDELEKTANSLLKEREETAKQILETEKILRIINTGIELSNLEYEINNMANSRSNIYFTVENNPNNFFTNIDVITEDKINEYVKLVTSNSTIYINTALNKVLQKYVNKDDQTSKDFVVIINELLKILENHKDEYLVSKSQLATIGIYIRNYKKELDMYNRDKNNYENISKQSNLRLQFSDNIFSYMNDIPDSRDILGKIIEIYKQNNRIENSNIPIQ
jgi:hypothetical protein